MSHLKEREEKVCLNCGTSLYDRYCHKCGQENIEPKQTFRHLLTHFFNDVTHFDSRFWATLKPLMIKPGFLSEEYIKGRRTTYIDPVRMYLFISAAYFILFFSLRNNHERITIENHPRVVQYVDSVRLAHDMNKQMGISDLFIEDKHIYFLALDSMYRKGQKHFDSVQATLPPYYRPTGIGRILAKKLVSIWAVYDNDPYNFSDEVFEKFEHSISKVFFISLPFFTLFLFILYFSRRKEYYYVSHAIFSLHCYCVTFLVLLFIQLLKNKYYALPNDIYGIIVFALMLGGFFYLYKAMRRFYKQGRLKTGIKAFFLSTATFILILLIILSLLVNSFFSMAA